MKFRGLFWGLSFLAVLSLFFVVGCGSEAKEPASYDSMTGATSKIQEPAAEEKPEVKEVEKQETEKKAAEIKERQEKKYDISLKPATGETQKYRFVSESVQSVEWTGVPEKEQLPSGENFTRVEMVFSQKVEDVNENGNIVYQITIDSLKLLYKSGGRMVRDFDSERGNEPASPLARLVGQSYTVEKSPQGQVVGIEATELREMFGADQSGSMAMKLLDDDSIEKRHGILRLPESGKSQLSKGGTWSGIEAFDFGLMGQKSYEKIYMLESVSKGKAKVSMEGIPSSEMAEELHQQKGKDLSGMFSSSGEYKGELVFDLEDGIASKYSESLNVKWTAIEPLRGKKSGESPKAMTMGAKRDVLIERID